MEEKCREELGKIVFRMWAGGAENTVCRTQSAGRDNAVLRDGTSSSYMLVSIKCI